MNETTASSSDLPAGVGPGPLTSWRLLEWWADREPDRAAHTLSTGVTLTFGRWRHRALAAAAGLRQRGVGPGSHVGLAFPRSALPDFAVYLSAVHALGATAVLLPADDSADDLAELAAICPLEAVVTDASGATRAAGAGALVLTVSELWEATGAAPPVSSAGDISDTATVVFTSGTTGVPRAVGISHRDLMAEAPARPDDLGTHVAAGSTHLHAFQPSTSAAHWTTLAPLLIGIHLVTVTELNPRHMMGLIEAYGVSEIAMVPAMAAVLRRLPVDAAPAAASDVRRVTMGTARCPKPTLRHVGALFPHATLLIEYSSTESGAAGTAYACGAKVSADAVGWPSAGGGVRIVAEDGTPLPQGSAGTVELRLPPGYPPRHYVNDPESTARTFRDGWVRMPDIGYVDEEGCLHLVGRSTDFVNVSGRKVSCPEVERVFESHPGVIEAAAFPVPDPLLGEELAVAVVTESEIAEEELRQQALSLLPPYKVPGVVAVVDALPRTRSGKVRKGMLPALIASRPRTSPSSASAEDLLCQVAREVIGVDEVRGTQSFYTLGATSLQVLRIYTAVTDALDADVDIGLFDITCPLSQLARLIEDTARSAEDEEDGE